MKYHVIREFTEVNDGVQQGRIMKINYLENTSDMGTKNLEVHLFKKHDKNIVNGMPTLRERIYSSKGIYSVEIISGGMLDGV